MKFSLMTLNYLPNKGGLVSYVQSISKEITQLGHQVVIYTTDGKNEKLPHSERIDNVQVIRKKVLNMKSVFKLFTPIVVPYKLYKSLKTTIDEDEFIIVRHIYFAAAMSFFKKRDNSIYIVPLVAPRLQILNIKQVNIWKKIYYAFLVPQLFMVEKLALNRLKHIGTLSISKKEEIVKYYNIPTTKVHVIPPGVDLTRFRPLINHEEKDVILKREGLESLRGHKVILTVCRLSNEKNVTYAIDMISHMDERYKLLVVGDGEEFLKLKKYTIEKGIEEKVIFTGFKSNTEDFYRVADLFILASKYEGFGHVYLEAMASGIPCVGLQHNPPKIITATHEIIEHGMTGFIDEGIDSKGLAEQVMEWFQDSSKVKEFKKNSRNYVEENHSWGSHFNSIISIFDLKWENK